MSNNRLRRLEGATWGPRLSSVRTQAPGCGPSRFPQPSAFKPVAAHLLVTDVMAMGREANGGVNIWLTNTDMFKIVSPGSSKAFGGSFSPSAFLDLCWRVTYHFGPQVFHLSFILELC